jgi:hypothetical protein
MKKVIVVLMMMVFCVWALAWAGDCLSESAADCLSDSAKAQVKDCSPITVKGFSLKWEQEKGYVKVTGDKLTLFVHLDGMVEKISKKIISIKEQLPQRFYLISSASFTGTSSTMTIGGTAGVVDMGPGAKQSVKIGKFQCIWWDNLSFFELKSNDLHLRVWTCGMIEKKEWKEINPNEQ